MEETLREGYERVSDILGQWSLVSSVPPEILTAAAERGTRVHEAIRDFADGLPVVLPDDEGGQFYRSFLIWFAAEKPVFQFWEKRFYDDELMITGRIDAVMLYKGQIVLVDWKTQRDPTPIIWNLQANFYMYLLRQAGHEFVTGSKALFVKLNKFGDMPQVYDYTFTERGLSACKACVEAYREVKELVVKKQKKELQIEV